MKEKIDSEKQLKEYVVSHFNDYFDFEYPFRLNFAITSMKIIQ